MLPLFGTIDYSNVLSVLTYYDNLTIFFSVMSIICQRQRPHQRLNGVVTSDPFVDANPKACGTSCLLVRKFPVRNHYEIGVSPRVLHCVVDTGNGLDRSLGDCRPVLPKGRKYQMVKTQTESHVRRPVV